MNKYKSISVKVLLAAVVLLMGGCFNLQRPFPEKQHFMLALAAPTVRVSQTDGILKVQNVGVSAPYGAKSFVYARGQGVFETDYYHVFFVAPGVMFTELIRRRMETSGAFRHVVESSSYMEATHILEGTVTALYGDYGTGETPRAILEMVFLLLNNTGSAPGVIIDKSYRLEIPVQGISPRALVKGWNQALEGIMTAFEKNLGEVLSKTS